MVEVAHWIGVYVAVQGGVHELSRVRDRSPLLLLRSTKEERFLISWATCDRVGFLCTQAKADPCFFVRSVGRPGVHLFSAILNDVTISLLKGCCLVNDVTISLRKGCCLVLRSLSDVRERGC